VTLDDPYIDEFASYEDRFDPLRTDRRARRRRKPEARHVPKKARGEIVAELAEVTVGLESGFATTYRPSEYEAEYLPSALRSFYDQELISDVLALVKGGKEASVYRCAACPGTGMTLAAAKVYRPRKFRNLRNDAIYREGRAILTANGIPVNPSEHRIMRALGKKTPFGVQVERTSWLMHEYTTLQRLYRAGAAVPRPIAASHSAILMSYRGDERMSAPTLHEISPEPGEAAQLFQEVLRNIELMLQQGLIHGDLSAYNILYWAGEITLIDFPQVTDSYTNSMARLIFQRDVMRICEYFTRQGVPCDATTIANDLWLRYVGNGPEMERQMLLLQTLDADGSSDL
jgi:RIO kinase 1